MFIHIIYADGIHYVLFSYHQNAIQYAFYFYNYMKTFYI